MVADVTRRPHITAHTMYVLSWIDALRHGVCAGESVTRWQCRMSLNSTPVTGWGDTPMEAWFQFTQNIHKEFPQWISQHLVSILSAGRENA